MAASSQTSLVFSTDYFQVGGTQILTGKTRTAWIHPGKNTLTLSCPSARGPGYKANFKFSFSTIEKVQNIVAYLLKSTNTRFSHPGIKSIEPLETSILISFREVEHLKEFTTYFAATLFPNYTCNSLGNKLLLSQKSKSNLTADLETFKQKTNSESNKFSSPVFDGTFQKNYQVTEKGFKLEEMNLLGKKTITSVTPESVNVWLNGRPAEEAMSDINNWKKLLFMMKQSEADIYKKFISVLEVELEKKDFAVKDLIVTHYEIMSPLEHTAEYQKMMLICMQ